MRSNSIYKGTMESVTSTSLLAGMTISTEEDTKNLSTATVIGTEEISTESMQPSLSTFKVNQNEKCRLRLNPGSLKMRNDMLVIYF